MERAKQLLVSDYDLLVTEELVQRPQEVGRSKRLDLSPGYAELLERTMVLAYMNDDH